MPGPSPKPTPQPTPAPARKVFINAFSDPSCELGKSGQAGYAWTLEETAGCQMDKHSPVTAGAVRYYTLSLNTAGTEVASFRGECQDSNCTGCRLVLDEASAFGVCTAADQSVAAGHVNSFFMSTEKQACIGSYFTKVVMDNTVLAVFPTWPPCSLDSAAGNSSVQLYTYKNNKCGASLDASMPNTFAVLRVDGSLYSLQDGCAFPNCTGCRSVKQAVKNTCNSTGGASTSSFEFLSSADARCAVPQPSSKSKGNGGKIAGAVIGSLVAVALIGGVVFYIFKRRNRVGYSSFDVEL